ncbi:MAG: carboxypeptidase-like regulatory domain-containing protein [Crocinitomicaceae bacterium]|nr:carboxypeptidase-like regulatory domain-containing protein [Crocinitomicaceae bacterium]
MQRLLFLFLLIIPGFLYGQSITGVILDNEGNPVPYVKVYAINFTNLGAVSNENGEFFFGCDFGNYDLLFKCVGFEDQVVNVTVNTQTPTEINVLLVRKQNELMSVEVSEKKKNVGWEIVNNVINNKKNFCPAI